MAVVQISRIQVRRGRKNAGTGLPQLASGEVAWAVDTQELYIGNGAVSEGSPTVGNTKILTERDNLLSLAGQYEYRTNSTGILTGINPNYPIIRSLQDRLDETLTVYSFGVVGNGINDDTATIQNAINQVYMTTTARANVSNRAILVFPPGTYKLTSTLKIPSYVNIKGAGSEKTVFNYIGDGVVFEFVNDSSRPANYDPDTLTYNNQPKFIQMSGFSVNSQTANKTVIKLDSVRDSTFEDIIVTGLWNQVVDSSATAVGGLQLNAFSTVVTCQNNTFRNVSVSGFTFCVFAKGDVIDNHFVDCSFVDCYQAFLLGRSINGSTSGQLYGPRRTLVVDSKFENIKRHGVYLFNGTGNSISQCTFINVGNNGGGNATALYNHIYFGVVGNQAQQNFHDRQADLASSNVTVAYVGEVGGKVSTQAFSVNQILINQVGSPILAFRLPISSTITGYSINYTYYAPTKARSRQGNLSVLIDVVNNSVQLTDTYDWFGPEGADEVLEFSASLLALANGITKDTLAINYKNPSDGEPGSMLTYSYSVIQ
jgi:hypothetical protein